MPSNAPRQLSRRDFLKLAAAVGITAAGVHVIDTYSPWLTDEQPVNLLKPGNKETDMPVPMLELVRYAILAASGHNTQPWKFKIGERAIQIYPDTTRHLPVVDPENREMWISLGCALENLLVAAHALGFATDVSYPDTADYIEVHLAADKPQPGPLFDAIPLRQNTRSAYDGQPVPAGDLEKLNRVPLEPGISAKFITNSADRDTIKEQVYQGNLAQYADQAFVHELIAWLRFNKKEAVTALDGLYTRCTGNPQVPRWLGNMFVSGTKPGQQADADTQKLNSSSGIIVLSSEADSKTAWVRTGQVYERLALQMTTQNIKSAFLNQPIEVSELRDAFRSAIGLDQLYPQLMFRFGYAKAMPRSLRRPAEQVLL